MEIDLETLQTMGHRVYVLRAYCKLTQTQFAKKLTCSQKYISDWESGRRWIPTKYIWKISKEFNIPFAFFDPQESNFVDYLKNIEK